MIACLTLIALLRAEFSVNSNIFRHLPWPLPKILPHIGDYVMKTPREGAATSVYCALSDEPLAEGKNNIFFGNTKAQPVQERVFSKRDGQSLWEQSEQMVDAALALRN